MTYTREFVKCWVEEILNYTKESTTNSCIVPYKCIKQFDPFDKYAQHDIHEYTCEDNMLFDTIQSMAFNDQLQMVVIIFYEAPMKEEVKEMKKYTLENYKEFCREALDAPPMEAFEDGTIDEDKWFEENKIHIRKGNYEISIEYTADVVNEIEWALGEIYEEEYGDGTPTTGNTVGSEYRPAELKDIIHVALQEDWNDWGWKRGSLKEFIDAFVEGKEDISDIICWYNTILSDVKHYTDCYHCNFGNLNMYSMRNINPRVVRGIIRSLIGTDKELLVGYDNEHKCSDITFIMDYTIKNSGELIGWFYGDQDEKYINELIEDYKNKLFGEEK